MSLYASTHAVERYISRVKPQLGLDQARLEVAALLELAADPLPSKPAWINTQLDEPESWIELTPDVVGAVRGSTVTTIVARAGHSKKHRLKKKEAKKKQQAERDWRNNLRASNTHKRGRQTEWV